MFNSIEAIGLVKTKAKLDERGGNVRRVLHSGETEEQAALVEWADKTVINGILVGKFLIHIPNEGKRGPKAAADAKRLGLRPGVPDLFLAIPSGKYHGLWIEMKAKTGKVTSRQKEWIERLCEMDYRAEACYGYYEAKTLIKSYLCTREIFIKDIINKLK